MASNNRGERIVLPDVPKEQWSDFRVDYEAGMTLADIAVKYYCDPRTVKTALSLNRGSHDFGKRIVPKKLDPHLESISATIQRTKRIKSLSKLSQQITTELQKDGYTGGERTVRNYLYNRPDVKAMLETQQKKIKEDSHDQH